MNIFAIILTNLQAVIAAKAARERTLTVLLVALWGRIARARTRLERLIGLWRAGRLPAPRSPRAPRRRPSDAADQRAKIKFPTSPGWLRRRLGHEVAAFGSQLQHLLTEAECQAFLAACPQAGRILRPLLRMLTPDPLPTALRETPPMMAEPAPVADRAWDGGMPAANFLPA